MKKWTETERNTRLFYYVVFLFLLTLFLRFVLVGIYRADCGGSDQNVVYGIQRLLLGAPLYQNPSQPPYAIIQYTPLFYYVVAGSARLLGIDGYAVQSIYEVARCLNILFNLLTILLVAGILKTWRLPYQKIWTYALPAIMILTTHYYVRIDSLQLLCFTAAMAAYVRYLRRQGAWRLAVAALLCGACIMSKQSGMLAAGIIGFSLFFQQKRYITGLLFCAGSILTAGVIAWCCTGGNWTAFYQNPYLGLKNGLDFTWLYTIFTSQFYFDLVLCYITGFIIAFYAFRTTTDPVYRFIATGAVLSFLFALITGLKIGSSNNYFTEFLVFVLIGLPCLLQSTYSSKVLFCVRKWPVTIRAFAGIAFFVLITSKTMGFFTSIYIERRLVSDSLEYSHEQQLLHYFKDELKLRQGEYIFFTNKVFLDNVFIGYSLMPCKDVIDQTYKADPATFDYSAFIKGMNNGLIKYVVIPAGDEGLNVRMKEELRFVHFDEGRFARLAVLPGYIIYRYQG